MDDDGEEEEEDHSVSMKTPQDQDSGLGRDTGADGRISQSSAASGGQNHHQRDNAKLWASFKKHVRRFGGSTGSLSSPSPEDQQQQQQQQQQQGAEDVTRETDSPPEGGFDTGGPPPMQSAALLKRRIAELSTQLSTAESDKQKIAYEAYRWVKMILKLDFSFLCKSNFTSRRHLKIKSDCDAKLEDARLAQNRQVSLVERLRVRVSRRNLRACCKTKGSVLLGQGCGLPRAAGFFQPKGG